MAKMSIAVRNISNRPLSFEFTNDSLTVRPGCVSKYILETEWTGTFAEKQLAKYIEDREAQKLTKQIVETKTNVEKSNQTIKTAKNDTTSTKK